MNPPETIATERLLLRRPRTSDVEAVVAFGSDPQVMQYLSRATLSDPTGTLTRTFELPSPARMANCGLRIPLPALIGNGPVAVVLTVSRAP